MNTQGPWVYCPTDAKDGFEIHSEGEPLPYLMRLATVHAVTRPEREAEANAQLICAAPDLLAALEELLPWAAGSLEGRSDEIDGVVDRCRAAISRAKEGR